MTIPTEPPTVIAAAPCPAGPVPGAAGHPRYRPKVVHLVASSRRGQPANIARIDPPSSTERLLRRRDDPPAGQPDGARLRIPLASRWTGRQRRVDGWPLGVADPSWVDGYRLVSRLGAGGMADVFYAIAPTGGPVAVKLLRASGGVPQTCQREYLLASAVDADCTTPALGHGMSTAGAYLVTTYLPGYRCGTTLVGAPIPVWAVVDVRVGAGPGTRGGSCPRRRAW